MVESRVPHQRPVAKYPKIAHIVLSIRSEEHTSELQSRPHISYAVFCLKKKRQTHIYPPLHIFILISIILFLLLWRHDCYCYDITTITTVVRYLATYKKYIDLMNNKADQDISAFLKETHAIPGFRKVGAYFYKITLQIHS